MTERPAFIVSALLDDGAAATNITATSTTTGPAASASRAWRADVVLASNG